MTLKNRITKVEEQLAPSAAVERAERRRRWCARWRRRSLYQVLLRIHRGAGDGADEFLAKVVDVYLASPAGCGFDTHPLRRFIDCPVFHWGDSMNNHPHAELPEAFPRVLIEFLLTRPAVNLYHSCERCGLYVPVWRDRPHPDCVVYPTCPNCGGTTGYEYYGKTLRAARELA